MENRSTNSADVGAIKSGIQMAKGRSVRLKPIGGRRKTHARIGVIDGVYRSIFTVALEDGGRVAFSYADVYSKSVEITVL